MTKPILVVHKVAYLSKGLISIVIICLLFLMLSCSDRKDAQYYIPQNVSSNDEVGVKGQPFVNFSGSHICYLGTDDNIYVKAIASGDAIKIDFPRKVYSPKLSADGEKLYFLMLSEARYYSELWRLNLNSGEKKRLSKPSDGDVQFYSLSDNDEKLVYSSFSDAENDDLVFIVGLNEQDGKPTQLFSLFRGPKLAKISSDNKHIFLKVAQTLYLAEIESGKTHQLTDGSFRIYHLDKSGVFIASKDDFYQVFRIIIDEASIEQQTFTSSHKILPSISRELELRYLNIGSRVNLFNISLLKWTQSTNYSDYLNNWGRVSWRESSNLEFLNNIHSYHGDEYLFGELKTRIKKILSSSDISSSIMDYRGESKCGWSATRYSVDRDSKMRHVILDAMLGLQFARFVANNRPRNEAELNLLKSTLQFLQCMVENSLENWRNYDNDTLSIIKADEGYLQIPYGSPERFDGINVPFNYQSRYSQLLYELYLITDHDKYLDKVEKTGRLMKRHLYPDGNGLKWHYWWGIGYSGWDEGDKVSTNTPSSRGSKSYASPSYAGIDLEFMIRVAQDGVVFGVDEINKLTETFKNGGTIDFNRYQAGTLLSKFDIEIATEILKTSQREFLDIQLRYIPLLNIDDSEVHPWRYVKRFSNEQTCEIRLSGFAYPIHEESHQLIYLSKLDNKEFELAKTPLVECNKEN